MDPFAGAPTRPPLTEEEKEARDRTIAIQPLTRADLPEGFDPMSDALMWETLSSLRAEKVESEFVVRRETRLRDELEGVVAAREAALSRARSKLMQLDQERNLLLQANALAGNDLDVLVSMRQGQDEVTTMEVVPDYSDALLVPKRVVAKENGRIRAVGERKVAELSRIRDFRKELRYMEWERQFTDGLRLDAQERFLDLQLLRITKGLEDFIQGRDMSQKQKEKVVMTEKLSTEMKMAHKRSMTKLGKVLARVESQVRERRAENERLEAQLRALHETVDVRDTIHRAKMRGAAGGLDPHVRAQRKMDVLVERTRLVSAAKAQAQEIEFLRLELDKLRQRTFPSFARTVHPA